MEKYAAILRAARQLFFAHGLEGVKVDQIALEAGVSKMTVYANFSDKAAIFEAVVAQESTRIDAVFADLKNGTETIDVILTQIGMTLMTFLMSADVMRLDQMLSSEMTNHHGLGSRFYETGPMRMWQELTDIISAAELRGVIAVNDAQQAAEDLIALWFGLVPLQHRFSSLPVVTKEQISARVDHGVAVFLKAYRSAT